MLPCVVVAVRFFQVGHSITVICHVDSKKLKKEQREQLSRNKKKNLHLHRLSDMQSFSRKEACFYLK